MSWQKGLVVGGALVGAMGLGACKSTEKTASAMPVIPENELVAPVVIDTSKPMPPGLTAAFIDSTVNACDDFYQHACGGWAKSTEIPADRGAWSLGNELYERNQKQLFDMLTRIASGKAPENTPYPKKLADVFATCMDEKGLEKGLTELKKQSSKFKTVKDTASLTRTLGWMQATGLDPLFGFGSGPDLKNPNHVIGQLDQGGLGLPDRDYYLAEDEKRKTIVANYEKHVAKMLELSGELATNASKQAKDIVGLETALAKASLTKVEQRDPKRLYNRLDRAGIIEKAPNLDWAAFFKDTGVGSISEINVGNPAFFVEASRLAKETPYDVWRAYLNWVLIRQSVPALPKRFQDESFQFASANLSGAKEDLPRWKKCVGYTDQLMGEALAVPYVAAYFGADAKETTQKMVKAVEGAFEDNLANLQWMDEETRERAKKKLHAIVNKVGYPDAWRKYDAFKTDRSSFLANWMRGGAFEAQRTLAKIGKDVDRTEWWMTPPTVNAYYDPTMNEIVFPAGILQAPYFSMNATDAVNFGAIGMVVGHEITHGFDDEGRQFDFDGSLNDWWTPKSGTAFTEKAACVQKRYGGEVAIDDTKVNGALTLGENIADMGGMKLSLLAYAKWKSQTPPKPEGLEYRYTDVQQYFLGYAQSWCTKYRPEVARVRAHTDPHSPPFLRVNVPLSNMREFQRAFGCSNDSKMVKSATPRCEVW